MITQRNRKIEFLLSLKKGNKIKIKKSNRGKFTDYCGGDVTSECIQKGKSSSNSNIRKMATFAENARKWKHKSGGTLLKKFGQGGVGEDLVEMGKDLDKKLSNKYAMAGLLLNIGLDAFGTAATTMSLPNQLYESTKFGGNNPYSEDAQRMKAHQAINNGESAVDAANSIMIHKPKENRLGNIMTGLNKGLNTIIGSLDQQVLLNESQKISDQYIKDNEDLGNLLSQIDYLKGMSSLNNITINY